MTCNAVDAYHLFLEEYVVTDLQYTDSTIEVSTHKVGEVELIVGRAYKHRTSLLQTCHRLTTNVVV